LRHVIAIGVSTSIRSERYYCDARDVDVAFAFSSYAYTDGNPEDEIFNAQCCILTQELLSSKFINETVQQLSQCTCISSN